MVVDNTRRRNLSIPFGGTGAAMVAQGPCGAAPNSPELDGTTWGDYEDSPDRNCKMETTTSENSEGERNIEIRLPEDVFSLLLFVQVHSKMSKDESPAFVKERMLGNISVIAYVFVTFLVQITILVLVLFDLFEYKRDNDDEREHIQIFDAPAGVTTPVRAAQFCALLVAVATQDDALDALSLAVNYPLRRSMPGTAWWFFVSNSLRCIEGLTGLFISFVIVIQSNTTIDLFANFAGMAFVAEIDNVAFKLAVSGYISSYLQHRCMYVNEYLVPDAGQRSRCLKRIVALLLFMVMVGFWSVLTAKQMRGDYYPRILNVRIGDTINIVHGFHSGVYYWDEITMTKDRRPIYMEQISASNLGSEDGNATVHRWKFGYCQSKDVWTSFSVLPTHDHNDPCKDIVFQSSPKSKTYDITKVAASDWAVQVAQEGNGASLVPVPEFAVSTFQMCKEQKDCNGRGICANGKCECDHHWTGLKCEFKVCDSIGIEDATRVLPGYSSAFHVLREGDTNRPLQNYGRSIYYANVSRPQAQTVHLKDRNWVELMIFTGRRWHLLRISTLSATTIAEIIKKRGGVHGELFSGEFISQATDRSTPEGLKWLRNVGSRAGVLFAEIGEDQNWEEQGTSNEFVDTSFVCTDCDMDSVNACGANGYCNGNTCFCLNDYNGYKCHIPPLKGRLTLELPDIDGTCGVCEYTQESAFVPDSYVERPIWFTGVSGFVTAFGFKLTETQLLVVETEYLVEPNGTTVIFENGTETVIAVVPRSKSGTVTRTYTTFVLHGTKLMKGGHENLCQNRYMVDKQDCFDFFFALGVNRTRAVIGVDIEVGGMHNGSQLRVTEKDPDILREREHKNNGGDLRLYDNLSLGVP